MSILSVLGRRKASASPHDEGTALVDYAGAMLVEASDALSDAIEHFTVSKRIHSDTIKGLTARTTEEHIRHEASHQAMRRAEDLADQVDVLLGGNGDV